MDDIGDAARIICHKFAQIEVRFGLPCSRRLRLVGLYVSVRTAMRDPQFNEFEKRLHRIDQIHQAGGAFEASGSLGRSYFDSVRPKARRALPLRGVALVLAGALLFKGLMLAEIGQQDYNARVASLADGSIFERIGAWVMHADAATQAIAGVIWPLLH